MKKLTSERLINVRACRRARINFKKLFPNGTSFLDIDVKRISKWAELTDNWYFVGSACRWGAAHRLVDFHGFWFTRNDLYDGKKALIQFARRWRAENK